MSNDWPFDNNTIETVRKAFDEAKRANQKEADVYWNSLSYEDRCNAFHAVVERIVKGDIEDKGSYRWVLYDVFGFGPDMYTRGMDCGYMTLHNAIVDNEPPIGWKVKEEAE